MLDVSSVRHSATAFRARGSVERSPSLCRKARASSLPRVAPKWAFARWVISLSDASSFAWSVTDREAWKSLSLPRWTSSLSRVTSSRAISASGDMVRPFLKDRLCADSKRTFCHSSVLAACSAGMGPTWTDRSIGAPADISPWRKPGASDRGHLPRWRERTRLPPMRMSRRPISTSTCASSSNSVGEPPMVAETRSIRSWRPLSGWTDSPALESRPRRSSMRVKSHTA